MALSFLKKRSQQQEMSFIDHLEELRWHIVRSLIAIIVVAILLFVNMNWFSTRSYLGLSETILSPTQVCAGLVIGWVLEMRFVCLR
jgi:Sec-independent protein secretion pathway component TatC